MKFKMKINLALFSYITLIALNTHTISTKKNQYAETQEAYSKNSSDSVIIMCYFQKSNASSLLIFEQIYDYTSNYQYNHPQNTNSINFIPVDLDSPTNLPSKPVCSVVIYKNQTCIFEEVVNPASVIRPKKLAAKLDKIINKPEPTKLNNVPEGNPSKPDAPAKLAFNNTTRRCF